MSISSIIKYTGNAITKYTGGNSNHNSNNSSAIAPGLSGRLKAYNSAPEMENFMQGYYGLDLSQIPNMTPEQLGELADIGEQAKFFSENLPKIEQHVKNYIQGVVDFNEFVARCVKAGAAGMKKIDKATLDVFLQWQGYETNRKKLAKNSDIEVEKLRKEVEDYTDLAEYDLQKSFQIMAKKLAKQKQQIDDKLSQGEEAEQLRMTATLEKQRIKSLIAYGTKSPQALASAKSHSANSGSSSNGGNNQNIFSRLGAFFAGK